LKKLTEDDGSLHLFSSHGLNFPELMQLGGELGYRMPDVVAIYGIEIGDEIAFGEKLSSVLKEKTKSLVERIVEDIRSSLVLMAD